MMSKPGIIPAVAHAKEWRRIACDQIDSRIVIRVGDSIPHAAIWCDDRCCSKAPVKHDVQRHRAFPYVSACKYRYTCRISAIAEEIRATSGRVTQSVSTFSSIHKRTDPISLCNRGRVDSINALMSATHIEILTFFACPFGQVELKGLVSSVGPACLRIRAVYSVRAGVVTCDHGEWDL